MYTVVAAIVSKKGVISQKYIISTQNTNRHHAKLSGPIPAKTLRADSVPRGIFYDLMSKNGFFIVLIGKKYTTMICHMP